MNTLAASRPRRSLLWVPGDQPRKIEKAAKAGADVVVLDLEDGVAADRKDAARDSVAGALRDLDFDGTERFVRVAGRATLHADLAAARGADGICLPKVEGPDDLRELRSTAAEILGQVPPILAISAESPLGVLASGTLAGSAESVVAWMWGSEDMAAAVGCRARQRGEDFVSPLKFARDTVILLAAATGAQAIDTVYPFFQDLEGLVAECAAAVACGFDGKGLIHPSQVAPANEAFTPSPDETARAQAVVDAFAGSDGVVAVDGQMLDLPHLRAAQRTLARAMAAER